MALFFFHNRMINFKCLLQRCGPLVGLEREGEVRRDVSMVGRQGEGIPPLSQTTLVGEWRWCIENALG